MARSFSSSVVPVVVGAVLLVVAVPLAVLLHDWSAAQTWSDVVVDRVTDRGGVWQMMRGGFTYVAIPMLFTLLAAMALDRLRASRRTGILLLGGALVANLAVQALKHPGPVELSALEAIDPLSGHVGIVAAVTLGWVAFGPPARRDVSAWCAAAASGGVGMGVVLAGWHTVPQVLVPLTVGTGCVLLLTPWAPRPPAAPKGRARPVGAVAMTLTGLVAALGGLALMGPWFPVGAASGSPAAAVAVTCGVVVGLALAASGAVWWATGAARVAEGSTRPTDPSAERPFPALAPDSAAIVGTFQEVDEVPGL